MYADFIVATMIVACIIGVFVVSIYNKFQPRLFKMKINNKKYLVIEYIDLGGNITYKNILRYA